MSDDSYDPFSEPTPPMPSADDLENLRERVRDELEALWRGERRAVKEMVFESVGDTPGKLVRATYYRMKNNRRKSIDG